MARRCFFIFLVLTPLLAAAPSTAEQFSYDSHGKRDPFTPLIGQDKTAGRVLALSEVASIDDVKLEGIATQASGNIAAIMNGELVKEKFKTGELEVKKITKNSVTLILSGKEYTIHLPEEGGQKSE